MTQKPKDQKFKNRDRLPKTDRGQTIIKFFSDTHPHTHATPAHLLSPPAESHETKLPKPTKWTQTAILTSFLLNASGQVVPNLLTDNYRPYLTEEQKRQEIFKAPKAKTSQELNPDLYKYQNQNQNNLDQLIKQGLVPNPNNAFKNQAQIGLNKPITPTTTNYGIPKSAYEPGLSIQQRNQMMMEADMKAYEEQKVRSQQILSVPNFGEAHQHRDIEYLNRANNLVKRRS